MKKILLPELGEGINDVEIRDVLVHEGESIEKNQSILILETDKASMEIPSDYSGVVSKIYVKSGDNISPNDQLGQLSKLPKDAPQGSIQITDNSSVSSIGQLDEIKPKNKDEMSEMFKEFEQRINELENQIRQLEEIIEELKP